MDRRRLREKLVSMLGWAERARPLMVRAAAADELSDEMLALERVLSLALQDLIDIAAMVASSLPEPVPPTYAELFETLESHGVLDPELASQLVAMAGLRNRLAHDYAGLDRAALLGYRDDLVDFERFARAVVVYVESAAP